jgi:hypothetical protein
MLERGKGDHGSTGVTAEKARVLLHGKREGQRLVEEMDKAIVG